MNEPDPTTEENRERVSELFLLSAPSRDRLTARAEEMRDASTSSGETFREFAFRQFNELGPSDSRLGIIATDFEDLRDKLSRAIAKISEGADRIRDVSGIYFTENPLGIDDEGHPSKVGFLFPGEGSQYLGMLSDLAEHFPHVREILDHCEELNNTSAHGEKSSNRFFQDPESLSREELGEVQADLRRIDFAMFAVFIADWIMLSILERLRVNFDTISGHSAGELVALMAARVLTGSEEQFAELRDGFQELGKYAPDDAVESKLLALGTSAEKAGEIIDQASRDAGRELDAFVAMKNCPHQTVIVGTKCDTDLVEKEVSRRGLVFQHLELEQPYHTPLFEPYMAALRKMFAKMTFHPPETAIYSCTTGEPFPPDPGQISDLTLAHWECPVRFIELIQNNYRDGVRCFLEVGPRNHLCSFTEDILRGKDVLVLPTNLQRVDGVTQILHVVAQLFVHRFQVDPSFLFGMETYDEELPDETGMPTAAPIPVAQAFPAGTAGSGRDQVMLSHLQLMEEFLEMQQFLTETYLAGRTGGVQSGRTMTSPDPAQEPAPLPEIAGPDPGANSPLIDEVLEHLPHQQITARRRMLLDEDIFSDQHTVGGRELSSVVPDQHGLPLVPMTFSIEMIAEVASALFPELTVSALRDIRLYKWLDYHDESGEATAQVSAEIDTEASTDEIIVVEAKLFHWKAGEEPNFRRPAATANVELTARFPEAPPAEPYTLQNLRKCGVSRKVLYQNLFHGEEFQGVNDFGRFGDDGIEATIEVLPRTRLFRNNPEPEFLFDPVLLDVAMHPMCAWHLEQDDQSGRILLPIGVDRIEFYGPRPAVGTTFLSRAMISKETTRQFTHEIDIVGLDERVWCRMQGCHYWRFYLPFREFNFHGPKNVYMLSEDWDAIVPRTSPDSPDSARCTARLLDVPNDLRNPTMQPIGARVTLSEREFEEFRNLDVPQERQTQWLFGRIAAKEVVKSLWSSMTGERLFTADVEIGYDDNGRPHAILRERETPDDFPRISLSHSGMMIGAMAANSPHVGLDLEQIAPRAPGFLKLSFHPAELELLSSLDRDDPESGWNEWVTRFWCAKEAVGKALGHGLSHGPLAAEILRVDFDREIVHVGLRDAMVRDSPEFRDRAIAVQTSTRGKLAVASTVCDSLPLSQFRQPANAED